MQEMRIQRSEDEIKGSEEVREWKKVRKLSLLPGLGHLYLKNYSTGIGLLLAYFIALWIFLEPKNYAQPPPGWMLLLAGVGVTAFFLAYSILDSKKEFRKRMEKMERKRRKR
jgi:hypothetical protein